MMRNPFRSRECIEYASLPPGDQEVVDRLIVEADGSVQEFIELFRARFKFLPYLCKKGSWEYRLQGPDNQKVIN